jgi:hypothetical protein
MKPDSAKPHSAATMVHQKTRRGRGCIFAFLTSMLQLSLQAETRGYRLLALHAPHLLRVQTATRRSRATCHDAMQNQLAHDVDPAQVSQTRPLPRCTARNQAWAIARPQVYPPLSSSSMSIPCHRRRQHLPPKSQPQLSQTHSPTPPLCLLNRTQTIAVRISV